MHGGVLLLGEHGRMDCTGLIHSRGEESLHSLFLSQIHGDVATSSFVVLGASFIPSIAQQQEPMASQNKRGRYPFRPAEKSHGNLSLRPRWEVYAYYYAPFLGQSQSSEGSDGKARIQTDRQTDGISVEGAGGGLGLLEGKFRGYSVVCLFLYWEV